MKKLKQNERKMDNIVTAIMEHGKDAFAGRVSEKKKSLEEELRTILDKIQVVDMQLGQIPSRIDIEKERLNICEKMRFPSIAKQQNASYESSGNVFHELPFEEKKKLINEIFAGVDRQGKKYGIYIKRGKVKGKFNFVAYGRLGEWQGWIKDNDYEGGSRENGGKSVTAGTASAEQRSGPY